MNISPDQRFIDALRAVLRLEPLYRKLHPTGIAESVIPWPETPGPQLYDGSPLGGGMRRNVEWRGRLSRLNVPKPRYVGEGHMKRAR